MNVAIACTDPASTITPLGSLICPARATFLLEAPMVITQFTVMNVPIPTRSQCRPPWRLRRTGP